MEKLVRFEEYRSRVNRTVSDQRAVLVVTGSTLALIGLAAIVAPTWLLGWLIMVVGALAVGGGLITIAHWIFSRIRRRKSHRGLLAILAQSTLATGIGLLLILNEALSFRVLGILLGLLLTGDGVVQLLIGAQQRRWRNRIILFSSGLLTVLVGIGAGLLPWFGLPPFLVAVLVGLRFLCFGGSLILMGLVSRKDDILPVYGNTEEGDAEPVPGEAYAVFFGHAFHLGIYVGEGEVVHFLETKEVLLTTWEEFLGGRLPQHWEYPDIEKRPAEEVCRFAREQVGGTLPYGFFSFNCEHFAIWCLSTGESRLSHFSQVSVGIDSIRVNPLVGVGVEVWSRATERLAFQLGGAFGKRMALRIRLLSALVNRWLLMNHHLRRLPGADTPTVVSYAKSPGEIASRRAMRRDGEADSGVAVDPENSSSV